MYAQALRLSLPPVLTHKFKSRVSVMLHHQQASLIGRSRPSKVSGSMNHPVPSCTGSSSYDLCCSSLPFLLLYLAALLS